MRASILVVAISIIGTIVGIIETLARYAGFVVVSGG